MESLTAISTPPFLWDGHLLLLSREDIAARYRKEVKKFRGADIRIRSIWPGEVAQFKTKGWISEDKDSILSNLQVRDDDIAVIIFYASDRKGGAPSEGTLFIIRRAGAKLEFRGWERASVTYSSVK